MTAGAQSFRAGPVSMRDRGLGNAVAKKLRRDAPVKPVEAAMAEYGLSEGEARRAVYAGASRNTIDKIILKGGWAVALELIEDLLGEPLDDFISRERGRLNAEQERMAAADRRLLALANDLCARRSLGG